MVGKEIHAGHLKNLLYQFDTTGSDRLKQLVSQLAYEYAKGVPDLMAEIEKRDLDLSDLRCHGKNVSNINRFRRTMQVVIDILESEKTDDFRRTV